MQFDLGVERDGEACLRKSGVMIYGGAAVPLFFSGGLICVPQYVLLSTIQYFGSLMFAGATIVSVLTKMFFFSGATLSSKRDRLVSSFP